MPEVLKKSMQTSLNCLSNDEFVRLSKFIHSKCGIKIPMAKKIMLESRLQRRVRILGLESLSEYCKYLFGPNGIKNELVHMIDVVTTNKTDFFREPEHFDYLVQSALPELIARHDVGIKENLMVWSAGCSTGQEPYTLAMVLREFGRQYHRFKFNFTVLATDISTRVLEKAKQAIYDHDTIEPVPAQLKKKYLLKSKDSNRGLVRITKELRELVMFRRLNFLQEKFNLREPMDIIFCRNVIIYFDRPTQETLINKFCRHLRPGGYLFLGHSEALHGFDLPLEQVSSTVYRKL